ncbi:MAG: hypothetical protein K1X74_18275 [Pirellulales bacterium]|nr:hypothetical protein [Pirellulales bacterium]
MNCRWLLLLALIWHPGAARGGDEPRPFGADYPQLDSLAVGDWWTRKAKGPNPPPQLDVPRAEVIAFALYTHDAGVLKLTAQLFPLRPGEPREARLELQRDGQWVEVARAPVLYPGWSAHFRVTASDGTQDVPYRVRHGDRAEFAGLVRRDPRDKPVIAIATMSCNSSRTTGLRPEIIDNLRYQDPDLLFFAGDQTYRHTEHTAGWIEFGLQFRDVIRDRPTITIPDDHDVGHPNLWGAGGKRSTLAGNADGGYQYPVAYVNMVQRQQTWHLPDAVDPAPLERGIGVYFTRLRCGGIDCAILEDRKFKSAPVGAVPQLGPRPDHITDKHYDPASVDLPGLELLGPRQERFLNDWAGDWTGAELKVVLSQTALCGAVHMHGTADGRLLADLDCNGWPQSARRRALVALRRVRALHLCGDQHLAVVVKHGIDRFGDGPYAFTSPALVNTIYGRWWHPEDEQPGAHARIDCPLPWTGDYRDGFGNLLTMLAYANPGDINDERQRGDGYGLVRIDKRARRATIECWPRFADARQGDSAQFPGWPVTVELDQNDGRTPAAWLPELVCENQRDPVVEVIAEANGEVLYAFRASGDRFLLPVFAPGNYTVRLGRDRPGERVLTKIPAESRGKSGPRTVRW